MRSIPIVVLALLSLAYLMTGLVYDEGGFGVRLVLKPAPSLNIAYGGGEEGWWERSHPDSPAPWWLQGEQLEIAHGDWEGGEPVWVSAYLIGYNLTVLAWPALFIVFVVRKYRRNKRSG